MAVRIPEGVIAEVRERTDIVRTVEQYVTLKRSGANYTGLCPFHEEKAPSFVVSPQRRSFSRTASTVCCAVSRTIDRPLCLRS